MSRPRRILLTVAGSLAGLAAVLLIAGIVLVQTEWFRNFVREKIISSIEESTGGRVEIGSFDFDLRGLRAEMRRFVLHGTEPPGAAPLFQVKQVIVDLQLTSVFHGFVNVEYLLADNPQANVMVFPDGRTNLPTPKSPQPSRSQSGLQTVVNLAIRKFDLRDGSAVFADRKTDFHASGENLRAQLAYRPSNASYTGEIDLNPLRLRAAENMPLDVNIKLPLTLEADRIALANGSLATLASLIRISATVDRLQAPRATGHVVARVALDEARRAAGLNVPLDTRRGPGELTADLAGSAADGRIVVQSASVQLGQSRITASGPLTGARFDSVLALGELGRLLRVSAQPDGLIRINGNARFENGGAYRVQAAVAGTNLAAGQGSTRLTGARLNSDIVADPRRVEIAGLRLAALGGVLTGSGALDNMDTYQFSGKLDHFDIRQVARLAKPGTLGYAGALSGDVQAGGSLKNSRNLTARAALSIQPGTGGIPVRGRLNANYSGQADILNLTPSYLALPHSRLDLSGSLDRQIQVKLVTRNTADFQPVAAIPLTFQPGGSATIDATVQGKTSTPRIAAKVAVSAFSVEGRSFTRFDASLAASPSAASVTNALLTHGALQAQINASVGLLDWKPDNSQPVRVDASIRDADVADALALAGRTDVHAQGALAADAHIEGTVGDPRGDASFSVNRGVLEGNPFDSLAAHVVMMSGSVEIPTLQWIAGPSRLDARAAYQHAPNDWTRGTLQAHLASNQVQLAQFQSLVKTRPGLGGVVSLNADAAATVQPGKTVDIQWASVSGNVTARGLQMDRMNLGDFTASASTSGSAVQYNINSNFAGSSVRVTGHSLLTGDHETSADAQIANLPIERVLAVAGRRDLPVSGVLSVNGQVSGTLAAPRANVTLNITNGSAYQQPFSRLQAAVDYSDQRIDLSQLRLEDGANQIEISGSFAHPSNNLREGQVQFRVRSNQLQLARFAALRQFKPGLSGTVEVSADGAGALAGNALPRVSAFTANVATKNLAVAGQPAGDLTLAASTAGQQVRFNLTSNVARSDIRGEGTLGLTADYPVNLRVDLANLTYSGLSGWIGARGRPTWDASLDGQITVSGPVSRTDALRGSVQLTKLEAHSVTAPGAAGQKPRSQFEVHNEGPVALELDRSVVTIRSARLTGPHTSLTLSGSAPIQGERGLNLRADGNVQLEALQSFAPNVYSSGAVDLSAVVTGTPASPSVNGRLQLHNASFNTLDLPNGISDANGTVAFNGSEAIIQNFSAQSGGGKITASGLVNFAGDQVEARVQSKVDHVHVQASDSVTVEASADLSLVGTTSDSLVSGTVRIYQVAMRSHTDIASILNSVSAPPSPPSANFGFLAGMKFDVGIATTSGVQFRSTLTQNLQADANLTLRGSPDNPGMLGRVSITQGQIVFFGSKYNVDQGTISFFDPNQIEPNLNVDLSTTVQGVSVTLSVSGPADKMTLSYRSDPPLGFEDIVSLLGSGTPPSSDPVLAARQQQPPQQNTAQAGASMLLGQAVASPVAGRLQRLFGVSKLKIDPQVTGASNAAAATLTLEQQINNSITFTYTQDVTQSNPQNIRVEWAINPRWSAIAARDYTGEVNVDLFYKKRFK